MRRPQAGPSGVEFGKRSERGGEGTTEQRTWGSQRQPCPPLQPPLTGPAGGVGCCRVQGPSFRDNLHLVLSARGQSGEAGAVHLSSHGAGACLGTCLVQSHLVAVLCPGSMDPGYPELGGTFSDHIYQRGGEGGCGESKIWEG